MTAARVEIEEVESTKSEKFLAVVLAVFVLIGGLWTYAKVDDYVRDAVATPTLGAADRAAIDRLRRADLRAGAAEERQRRALEQLEVRREAYRTALEANRPATALEQRYRRAAGRYESAQRELQAAERAFERAQPAARAAQKRRASRFERERDREALVAFAVRLPFVVALLVAGLWMLSALRKRRSRYLPLAFAVIGVASVLAFVLAGDYITDYVDPLDLGPLILSLLGIGVTLLAFAALQRYLARRIPIRRVRKRECPFCGYPVSASEHCEGCGRQVVAECSTCGGERRVGTLHCGACGAA